MVNTHLLKDGLMLQCTQHRGDEKSAGPDAAQGDQAASFTRLRPLLLAA